MTKAKFLWISLIASFVVFISSIVAVYLGVDVAMLGILASLVSLFVSGGLLYEILPKTKG